MQSASSNPRADWADSADLGGWADWGDRAIVTRTGADIHHPAFARFYDLLAPSGEGAGMTDHRRRLLAGLSGSICEIGCGNGLNFSHYPTSVTEVIAVEPEPYLRRRAERAAATAPVAIRVVAGTAEATPCPDGSVDAVIASLVLCSVGSVEAALGEAHRILRTGGELRLYEHVAAEDGRLARRQHMLAPLWSRFGGGCRPDRDPLAHIDEAGFTVTEAEHFDFCPGPRWMFGLVSPHLLTVATKR